MQTKKELDKEVAANKIKRGNFGVKHQAVLEFIRDNKSLDLGLVKAFDELKAANLVRLNYLKDGFLLTSFGIAALEVFSETSKSN